MGTAVGSGQLRSPTGHAHVVVRKCERLTIAVLEQLCTVLGQRPFNVTHQINLQHSSLECYEVAGLIDASQVVSQPISDFLPTISRYFNNPLPKTINNRLLW